MKFEIKAEPPYAVPARITLTVPNHVGSSVSFYLNLSVPEANDLIAQLSKAVAGVQR